MCAGVGDERQSGVDIVLYCRCVHAQYAHANLFEQFLALRIMHSLSLVDATVHLHDQPMLCAIEVNNAVSDARLSSKLETIETPIAKRFPE
jgi:hypothetical protein